MSEVPVFGLNETDIADLKRQNEELVQTLLEVKQDMRSRVLLSELKIEAVRAGMIDLDCLKLLDLHNVPLEDKQIGKSVAQLICDMKLQKPWLFQPASSSTAGAAPPAESSSQKRVMEMSDLEYRSARAALLRRLSS